MCYQELIQRIPLLKVNEQSEFCHQVENLILTEHLPISTDSLNQFCDETAKDQSLQVLMQVVLSGWPEQKQAVPQEVQAYFTSRDELSVQDGLLFKSDRVFVPASLQQQVIHSEGT